MKILLALLLQAAPGTAQDPKPPLEWNQHLGAALRQAIHRKVQILAAFSSKGCGWCRRMEEETFPSPRVRDLLEPRVLVRVDVDAAPDAARALGVRAVPDVRLYTSEGLPLARRAGYMPPEELAGWIEKAAAAAPDPAEPSLGSLRPDPALDGFFDLEAAGKAPGAERIEALLALAAGPSGETRAEALRLVRKWASASAPALAKALGSAKLKARLAAYEALSELKAPLGKIDPWGGPAAGPLPEVEAWLKARPADSAVPADLPPAWTAGLEADLAVVEGERSPRAAAARERLIAAGPALVERLRQRSRSLRGSTPAAAARLDEVRFRILLPPDVVRRAPDAAERLAMNQAGARSQALEEVLRRSVPGLEPLLREALCDPDPLFRETAAGSARGILGREARGALSELLKDPEANVRAAALRELANIPVKGTAEAVRDYLASEKDPDMVGHAVRALKEVSTKTSRTVLRGLLESPHWSVRAGAVKALAEMRDGESLAAVLKMLKDPDAFVLGEALAAIAALGDSIAAADAEWLVDDLAGVLDRRADLVKGVLKTLGSRGLRKAKKTDAILRKFARHEDGGVRAAAVEALAEDTERPAFEEILGAMGDADARVRAAGTAGLRALVERKVVRKMVKEGKRPDAYPDCKPLLLKALKDPEAAVRLEAALTLMYFGDVVEARDVWRGFLPHADVALHEKAVEGLKWLLDERDVREAVLARWDAASREERESILDALDEAQRGVDLLGLLVEILPRVPEGLRRDWADALKSTGMDVEPGEAPVPESELGTAYAKRLIEASKEPLPPGDRALLRALALSYDWSLTGEEVHAALKDPEPVIRRSALAVLVRASAPLKAGDLEPLARDPSPQVRALALVACMPPEERSEFWEWNSDWVGGMEFAWHSYSSSGWDSRRKGRVIQLPEDLLNERLADPDPEVRLRAASLMTLEGSDDALAYLHRAWREKPTHQMRTILIRGVVGAWEDAYTSILEEVAETFEGAGDYYFRRMIQAVGNLKGERIKAWKAKMREEFGGSLNW